MKHYCILLAIFTILFVNVDGWVGIVRSDPGSEHLGHCYTKHESIGAMKKGEERRMTGQCVLITCRNNRDIHLSGCGVVQIAPPCKILDGILSKPFPDCCYEIGCPPKNPDGSFKTTPAEEEAIDRNVL